MPNCREVKRYGKNLSKQASRNQNFKEFNSLEKIWTRAPGNCRNNLNSSNFSIVLSLLPSLAQTRYVTSCKVFRDDITSERQDGFKNERVLLPLDQKGRIFFVVHHPHKLIVDISCIHPSFSSHGWSVSHGPLVGHLQASLFV